MSTQKRVDLPGRHPDAFQQILEARITAQRVQLRVRANPGPAVSPLVVALFQPL